MHEQVAASKRVLVVEDVDTTRRRLAALLGGEGYQVDQAADGLEALRRVQGTRYDAILLDLALPHLNGWQFRETALRHPELRAIPTVVLTGQALREPGRYALQTPFVLTKPFEDATVLHTLKTACAVQNTSGRWSPPAADDGLFWSKRGAVACATHAPTADTARWRDEGWSQLERAHTRILYQCQHCAGGPIAKRSRRRVTS